MQQSFHTVSPLRRSASDTEVPRDVEANGLSFHVRLQGPEDGPLILLLHGFPETGDAWFRQAPVLAAQGWRVAAPDQRGYGRSDKPSGVAAYALDRLADDVVALAQALGHARFAVVGHDWGGVVAWHLAARDGARVRAACILNAPHPASTTGFALAHPTQLLRSAYVGFFQLPWAPELMLSVHGHAALRHILTGSSRPGAFHEVLLTRYREAWRSEGALTAMLNWYRALALARPLGAPIDVPVQVVWGDRDAALASRLAEAGLHYCRQGSVVHLPEATHWLHHEAPEQVNALLIDFLRSVATSDAGADDADTPVAAFAPSV